MTFDIQNTKVAETSQIQEIKGSMSSDPGDKLMHSVLQGGKDEIEHGRVIAESINQGISSFMPDTIFRNLVNNYRLAENLYGETLIRKLTGYDPRYVKKNINIPEFQNQLIENIEGSVKEMKEKGLLDKQGEVTDDAIKISSLVMYMEELDRLQLKGFGEKRERKRHVYGEKEDIKDYTKDRYRDLALKASVKTAIRRKHSKLAVGDLKAFERRKRGKVNVIYALDASGSMKGKKLGMAKRAGIALAYKAVQEKNDVGIIVFGSDIKKSVAPCQNFKLLLEELARIRASMETDIAKTIEKSVEMFPKRKLTKHLILITDALPTKGEEPVSETLHSVSTARAAGITISVIGIDLDADGLKLARQIAEIGQGRLYMVKDIEEMDTLVLEDYYSLK
ncbi:VWA domain-containing protein [Nanoarchaeota archaeon]